MYKCSICHKRVEKPGEICLSCAVVIIEGGTFDIKPGPAPKKEEPWIN